jgi:hypothetical protein
MARTLNIKLLYLPSFVEYRTETLYLTTYYPSPPKHCVFW